MRDPAYLIIIGIIIFLVIDWLLFHGYVLTMTGSYLVKGSGWIARWFGG